MMGKKNGVGKFSWNDRNECYYGEFKDDLFNGTGDYDWSDGRSYSGEWRDGRMSGKGLFKWPGTTLKIN